MADDPKADLQFDKVESAAPSRAMVCVKCGRPIAGVYYDLRGKPLCESCKAEIDVQIAAHFAKGRGPTAIVRAVVYGLAAAAAGAVLYYAVAVLTGLEIGIVAIVIGYMVGYSIQKATAGVGGLRYQILAVVLTYLAVGASYVMLDVKLGTEVDWVGAMIGVVALPVYFVIKSGVSGILSAIIIGVGLRQAWRMTAGATVMIKGPFRVGGASTSLTQ